MSIAKSGTPFKFHGDGRYVAQFELGKDDAPGTQNHLRLEVCVYEDEPSEVVLTLSHCANQSGIYIVLMAEKMKVTELGDLLYGIARVVNRPTLEPL